MVEDRNGTAKGGLVRSRFEIWSAIYRGKGTELRGAESETDLF